MVTLVDNPAEAVPATPAAASPKKKKTPVKGKATAKKASTHPPTASMVNAAIKTLNERGGSSLQAIKKSISGTYKLDAEKLAPFIKKYLKSAVEKGTLIRTKGKGASGSFKLASKSKPEPKKKVKKVAPKKKPVAAKKEKSADAKPKKAKASPKKAAKKVVKPKAASKPKPTTTTPKKAPSKVKKTKATPTKKPKSPKPKKAVAKKPKKTITKK